VPEWDENNRPKDYIISVTPGFAKFGSTEEQLTNMGLARKTIKAARLGFEFAEIDFESLSEMFEPEIANQVNVIKQRQELEIGLHLPVDMDLCLAHAYRWKQMHLRLQYGMIAAAEKLKAKFGLFHTSSMARPPITAAIGERAYPSKMSAWNGINLGNWIEEESKNGFDIKDWFMAKFIRVLFSAMGTVGDVGMITYYDTKVREEDWGFKKASEEASKRWREILTKHENEIRKKVKERLKEEVKKEHPEIENEEDIEKLVELKYTRDGYSRPLEDIHGAGIIRRAIEQTLSQEEYKNYALFSEVEIYNERYDFNEIYQYWKAHGSECEESVAYHVIAKWMYKKGDKLYKDIVTEDKRDPDEIIYDADTKPTAKEAVPEAVKQIITAVAAKYIQGHLITKTPEEYGIPVDANGTYTKKNPEQVLSVLDYCKKHKLQILIETNMPGGEGGGEGGAPPGELRIIKATDHVKIVKNIDPVYLSYCIDFEHLLTNYVDPEQEAKELKKTGDGKYITCLHTNAPRPIVGAHGPIFPISNDMYIIYRYLYTLRQAGCKDAYIIWEMGSHGVQESAIAFRRLVHHLKNETPPEELPKEFYGLDETFLASQNTAIREHAFEPLEGMLSIPEESHTFLSKHAVDKGKGTEWGRERYR
jgi:hypothetical protein